MLDREIKPERPARQVAPRSRHVAELFLRRVEQTPAATAWRRKVADSWVPSTWTDFHDRAVSVATFLLGHGLALGDKVCIVGSTRPEWCICDVGGLLAGAITVGAYPTLAPAQLAFILRHSDSRVVFAEGREDVEKIVAIRSDIPNVELLVVWDAAGVERLVEEHEWIVPLSDVLETAADRASIDERVQAIDPAQTAIIVYTSGTTGPPKGAMISHDNVVTLLAGSTLIEPDQDDHALSFLPMAHVAERVLAFYGRINFGTSTSYATSIPAVLEEIKEVQPTIFGSVPRIFEKAYATIQSRVDGASGAKQRIFRWAESVGLDVVERWKRNEELPLGLRVRHRLADRLVFSKLREVFGGKVKYYVTGAAPIPHKVLDFFWAAGFPIYEVYGLTEATVLTHANRPGEVRLGSVGKPLPFVEDRLADDGEILLRGRTVFLGYYKDEEATAAAVDEDGWLHTGDIGRKDADGFLYIVDRKKHIIITAGGKNLTPANIENAIKAQDPMISQVHAHGDRRPYVSALVTVHPTEAIDFALAENLCRDAAVADAMKLELTANPLARPDGLAELTAKVAAHPETIRRVVEAIRRGNETLSRVERVRRALILDRDFALEEDEITPTLKVKRRNVEEKFADALDRLYEDDAFGITVQER